MVVSIAIDGPPVRRRHDCEYTKQVEDLVMVSPGVACVVMGKVSKVCVTEPPPIQLACDARATITLHIPAKCYI